MTHGALRIPMWMLRNVLYEALVYKRAGRELLLSDLPSRILRAPAHRDALVDGSRLRQRLRSGELNLRDEIKALERTAIAAALDESRGNAAEAARLLGTVGRGASRDPGGTVRAMKRNWGIGDDEGAAFSCQLSARGPEGPRDTVRSRS